ncbi:MoaB/Mog domain-containing protein [[Candida] zeylanoides]
MSSAPSINASGILIIGDEVLNGKILDTNSHAFAKYCFRELGVPLKRTVVCGDDEDDIIQSLQRNFEGCSLVVTSGGIGSTHDDISYPAIARAFGLACELDQEIVDRMQRLRGPYLSTLSKTQLDAFYRMATIPKGENVEKLYLDDELWVPVVGIDKKVYILPGVPQLFTRLMVGLGEILKPRVVSDFLTRRFVQTRTGESELAPFLTALQHECNIKYGKDGVKLGSYPHLTWKINTISIIAGSNVNDKDLSSIVQRVLEGVKGEAKEISADDEERLTTTDPENSNL